MGLTFNLTPLYSLLSPILLHANPRRPIFCSSISCPPTSLKPQAPLFLRPPIHSATLSDLQAWLDWARTLASSVGSTLLELDNGPEAELLHRELNWLIEDALPDPKPVLTHLGDSDKCNDASMSLTLRADLKDLYVLWKQRIQERRPFQYIVGCEHWRDLMLSVQEGVLIPRPETELIVDLVSDVINDNAMLKEGLWADLGTGSGAIAIGIGRILGTCGSVIATDLSPVAVAVASYNVQRYSLQNKVSVREGSWFEPLKDVEGKLAGLVSNPPYIPSEDIRSLQAEVAKHEPRLALDGGVGGVEDLLHLFNGVTSMLKPGGFVAFETNGEKQCNFLVDYIRNKLEGSFQYVNIVSDFAGIQRFVTGFRAR